MKLFSGYGKSIDSLIKSLAAATASETVLLHRGHCVAYLQIGKFQLLSKYSNKLHGKELNATVLNAI
jgi:hypothetical protein